MKRLVSILVVMIVMTSSNMIFAQVKQTQQSQQTQRQQRPEVKTGDFNDFQLQILTKQLHLEAGQVDKFKKLYTEYSQKMDALQPQPQRKEGEGGKRGGEGTEKSAAPSNEKIEAQILKSFEMAEKSTDLKREYYYKFKEIITPKQILSMYNIERRLRERIVSESSKREGEERPSKSN